MTVRQRCIGHGYRLHTIQTTAEQLPQQLSGRKRLS